MQMIPTTRRTRGAVPARVVASVAIVLGLVAYVAVAGSTGFCPTCAAIVGAVTGGSEKEAPGARVARGETGGASIHSLVMTDLQGNPVSFADFKGRPLLIDVWATWCAPCRNARKILHGIHDEIAEHGALVSVSVDAGGAEAVRTFIETNEGGRSPFVEVVSTDPSFNGIIRPHDRKPTIPKLIFVSADGRIIDIEYGVPRPNWVVNRIRQMASAASRG